MAITGMHLTQREKFNLRMDILPPNAMVNLVVLTDNQGQIIGWIIEGDQKIEGPYDYVDVTESEG